MIERFLRRNVKAVELVLWVLLCFGLSFLLCAYIVIFAYGR